MKTNTKRESINDRSYDQNKCYAGRMFRWWFDLCLLNLCEVVLHNHFMKILPLIYLPPNVTTSHNPVRTEKMTPQNIAPLPQQFPSAVPRNRIDPSRKFSNGSLWSTCMQCRFVMAPALECNQLIWVPLSPFPFVWIPSGMDDRQATVAHVNVEGGFRHRRWACKH